ncbi:MAG: Trk system potassium transporter TrkA [Clostridiales bacterium]|nr:Trk system potassium transporter TrkA [Clostridiales bacterium]
MRILIIGSGKLGHSLAENLIEEGHDITVVDRSDHVLQKGMDTLDAMFIKGSGVSAETLKEADVQHADIVIAATVGDEINMLSCLTAKRLGAQYAIARIRDPEYLSSLEFLQKELYIDYVINPERATAREISRMLRFPFAGNIETFARGRVEMVDFRAAEEDFLVGISLKDIYKKHKNIPKVLFAAVERDGEIIIPKGDFIIRAGDRVHVVSDSATITHFFDALGKDTGAIRSVMIMGGSRIAYYLASMLLSMRFKVSIIEINPEKARWLSEELPGATIIEGDGTDQELLESEGLSDTQAFVLLSDRDEENLMAGFYALQRGVQKVIVKSSRDKYSSIMYNMGLDSIISTLNVACNTILRTVRSRASRSYSAVERMYRLMDDQVEALEFIAMAGDPYIHVPLKNLNVIPGALIGVIVREGQVRIPFGNDTIEVGDHVVVISRKLGLSNLSEIIRKG